MGCFQQIIIEQFSRALLLSHSIFIFTNWFINKSLYRTTTIFSSHLFEIIKHMAVAFFKIDVHFKRISIDEQKLPHRSNLSSRERCSPFCQSLIIGR